MGVTYSHNLRPNKSVKDGKQTVVLRVYFSSKNKYFPVNFNNQTLRLTKEEFDSLGRSRKMDKVNKFLISERDRVNTILSKLQRFSFERFDQLYSGGDMLSDCFLLKIQELESKNKFSTIISYKGARKAFIAYGDDKVDNIDIDYLEGFVDSRDTYPVTYLKYLRHVLRKNGNHVFDDYTISTDPKNKKPLKPNDVKTLLNYKCPYPARRRAQMFFILMYFGGGMNLMDWAQLEWPQIEDGVISRKRSKNAAPIITPIMPEMQEIIDEYSSDDPKYVFGIMRHDLSDEENFKRYKTFIGNTRRSLRWIQDKLDIKTKITPYVARYTHAHMLRVNGVSLEDGQESMSHKDSRSTRIYWGMADVEKRRQIQEYLRVV